MLERLAQQPPDPLLGVMTAFMADPRESKIDLGVGVFRDRDGATPVMRAVKQAEARLLAEQDTKAYVGPSGDLEFITLMRDLVFGAAAPAERITGLQTPGGTGALRAAADLLARTAPRTVWLGRPTWANHDPVLAAAGLATRDYRYFNPASQSVDFEALRGALLEAQRGDIVLLQVACHNPTGADLTVEQWRTVAGLLAAKGLLPLFDLAYLGLGSGLAEDAAGLREVVAVVGEALVAVSCSKNFGLYRERTGVLFTLTANSVQAEVAQSNMLAIARANYSMPPDHGAAVARIILSDPSLTADWKAELDGMRTWIGEVRARVAGFGRLGDLDLAPLAHQHGMFSLLPLGPERIDRLRAEHAIYMTRGGRVNLAGLKLEQVEPLIGALREVLDTAPAAAA